MKKLRFFTGARIRDLGDSVIGRGRVASEVLFINMSILSPLNPNSYILDPNSPPMFYIKGRKNEENNKHIDQFYWDSNSSVFPYL